MKSQLCLGETGGDGLGETGADPALSLTLHPEGIGLRGLAPVLVLGSMSDKTLRREVDRDGGAEPKAGGPLAADDRRVAGKEAEEGQEVRVVEDDRGERRRRTVGGVVGSKRGDDRPDVGGVFF